MKRIFYILFVFYTSPLMAAEQKAVVAAIADLAQFSDYETRSTIRYIWLPSTAHPDDKRIVSFSVNSVLNKQSNPLPIVLASPNLIRIDFRILEPEPHAREKLLRDWDALRLQSYRMYVNVRKTVPEYEGKGIDGKLHIYDYKIFVSPAPHTDITQHLALIKMLDPGSNNENNPSTDIAAILEFDTAVVKMLSTANGGRYYRFMNFEGKKEDEILADLGINFKAAEEKDGDTRSIFLSYITGKLREVEHARGIGGRNSDGRCIRTGDIKNENESNTKKSVIRSILNFKPDAREIIGELNTGLHFWLLTDGEGNLIDVAPDNVARDSTIPPPFTNQLETPHSCIRCHNSDSGQRATIKEPLVQKNQLNGWKSLQPNLVKLLLNAGFDIVDDFSDLDLTREEAVSIVAGRYNAPIDQPDAPLGRARRDYAKAVRSSTIMLGKRLSPSEVGIGITRIFSEYQYSFMDSERACRQLQITPEEGQEPKDALKAAISHKELDSIFTDPFTALLLAGAEIPMAEWRNIYPDLALRRWKAYNEKELEAIQKR